MIKPQDIDLKELRFIRFKIPYTGTTGYNVKQFLVDKLNKIEKKKHCQGGYPHICNKHPENCEYYINWEDIIKEFTGK